MKTFALTVYLLSTSLFANAAPQSLIKDLKVQNSLDMSGKAITNASGIYDTNGNSLAGSGGSATNAYQSKVGNSLVTISTNTGTFVYTFSGVDQTNGWPWSVAKNVLQHGVLGGANDDTLTIQALLNSGGSLYFPPTNYTTSPLYPTNNTLIAGAPGAVFRLKAGSTNSGVFNIVSGATNVVIQDVRLDGLYYADPLGSWTSRSGSSNRIGVNLYVNSIGSRLQNVVVSGFDTAINIFGDQDGLNVFRKGQPEILHAECFSNYYGVSASSTLVANHAVEYFRLSGLHLHDNTVGANIGGGNIGVSGNEILENFWGIIVDGNVINPAHSYVSENHVTHNINGILVANVSGQSVSIFGNEIRAIANGTSIVISNSSEVSVWGNHFDHGANVTIGASGVSGSSKGPNFIYDNAYGGIWGTDFKVFDWNNFSDVVNDNTTNAQHWGNYSYETNGDFDPYRWNPYNTNRADGGGFTNLIHSSTVSGVSGVSVAPTQNPDGSTNYGLTVTAVGSGTVTSVNVAQQGFSSSGAVTGSGTITLTQNADKNHLNFGETNISKLGIGYWQEFTNQLGLVITNPVTGANVLLGTNGTFQVGGNQVATTNQLVPVDAATSTNAYSAFDANGQLVGTRNGGSPGWTNLVSYTHEGTTTNITAAFNGTLQTFTCTNGPSIGQDYFFGYAGANGSVSYRFAGSTYNNLHFTYQPKWLAGSNSVITNGVLSITSYGGTNAAQLEAAIKENQ